MPWSAKAQELLRTQYAAVGAAARAGFPEVVRSLEQAAERAAEAQPVLAEYRTRQDNADKYIAAYRHYCWPVEGLGDLKLAPFHLLATEGQVHADKDHRWHMETLRELCQDDSELFLATPFQEVDVTDPAACEAAVEWWETLTGDGGEGMVVKPLAFIPRGKRGLIQPAIKSRGREYLRIIYGPDYTLAHNLERLRRAAYPASAHWPCGSLRWGWKPWSALSAVNRSTGCTNACSGCWRWKANR